MRSIAIALVASCLALAACDHTSTIGGTPPGNGPAPAASSTPYECPAGMAAYKCEQLKRQNDPNFTGGNPS